MAGDHDECDSRIWRVGTWRDLCRQVAVLSVCGEPVAEQTGMLNFMQVEVRVNEFQFSKVALLPIQAAAIHDRKQNRLKDQKCDLRKASQTVAAKHPEPNRVAAMVNHARHGR